MTPTELKLLKIIWRNRERKASASKIAQELKISTDYARFICRGLLENKIVGFSQGQYEVTGLGKKGLEKLGVVERKKKKKKKAAVKVKKRAGSKSPKAEKSSVAELSDVGQDIKEALKGEGFHTLEDVATTNVSRLMEMVEGLNLKEAAHLMNKAREKLRKNGKEYLWQGE